MVAHIFKEQDEIACSLCGTPRALPAQEGDRLCEECDNIARRFLHYSAINVFLRKKEETQE